MHYGDASPCRGSDAVTAAAGVRPPGHGPPTVPATAASVAPPPSHASPTRRTRVRLQALLPVAQVDQFCNLLRWYDLMQHTADKVRAAAAAACCFVGSCCVFWGHPSMDRPPPPPPAGG